MAIDSQLYIAILTFFGYLQLTVNSHFESLYRVHVILCQYEYGL